MTTENKKICPKCRGIGFIKCNVEEGRVSVVVQCDLCNSKGEVYDKEFDDYFDSYVELKPLLKRRSN